MKKAVNLYFYKADTKEKLNAIKSNGYDGVLLSIYTKEETMSLDDQILYCKKIGLEIPMIHCQYNPAELDYFWDNESETAEKVMNDYIAQIESISNSGIKNFVVHLSGLNPAKTSKYGLKRLEKILKICEKYNINLCIENLEYPYQTEYIFENISHKNLSFCYDSGHKNCFSRDSKIAQKHSKIITSLHIHDNDGTRDGHMILGQGTANIELLAKEISMSSCDFLTAEIKYRNTEHSMDDILKQNLTALVSLDNKIQKLK